MANFKCVVGNIIAFVAVCKNGCSGGVCIAPGICANCPDINKVAPNCEG